MTSNASTTRKTRIRRPLTQGLDPEALAKARSAITGEPVVPPKPRTTREQRRAEAKVLLTKRAATHHLRRIAMQAHFDACQNPLPMFGPLLPKSLRSIARATTEKGV